MFLTDMADAVYCYRGHNVMFGVWGGDISFAMEGTGTGREPGKLKSLGVGPSCLVNVLMGIILECECVLDKLGP